MSDRYCETGSLTRSESSGYSARDTIGLQQTVHSQPKLSNYFVDGITLATNGQIYVKGHFNADGDPDTGSAVKGDNAYDAAAAVVGDAVTILSPGYDFTRSRESKPKTASFTEFNGALITGLTPTNMGGQQVGSGGSHNLPRFLEHWDKNEFRYRGSMVALFESELANEPWNTSYYEAPKRVWGFFNRFGQGLQPPGTPVLRTYYKLDFRYGI